MKKESKYPGAVILDGSFSSLAAARNLAKYGVPVCIVDTGTCVAQFSRYVSQFLKCPPFKNGDDSIVEFLLRCAEEKQLDGSVLFASRDEFVRVLAQHRDTLSQHYIVTSPPWEVTRHLYDKRLTWRLASGLGIPTPSTYNPEGPAEVMELMLDFPVVLKPAITYRFTSVTKKKAYRADSRADLIRLYSEMAEVIDPDEILIQELIPGRASNLYSYFGFFKEGEPVTGLSAQRSRQHPMEFGRASTFVETMNIPELEELSIRLLKGISYSGLAEVEFMYDPKHERFELLEVNPRFWGWHSIAIAAGVDLPYLAYAEATGNHYEAGPLRGGVKWARLITDVPTAALEIWHGRMRIDDYIRSLAGTTAFSVFSWSDPLPSVMELVLIPYYARTRGF